MDAKLRNYLTRHKIEYKVHKHQAVFTVAEAEKIKLAIPGVRTKSLFLKELKTPQFYLVCLPGEKRLDIKSLQTQLQIGKLKFSSSKEMIAELKVSPGNASIFCMINTAKTVLILDKEVWDAEVTGFHPNKNTATLEITRDNLKKFYNSLISEKHIIKL